LNVQVGALAEYLGNCHPKLASGPRLFGKLSGRLDAQAFRDRIQEMLVFGFLNILSRMIQKISVV